jgi:hypothetical protein
MLLDSVELVQPVHRDESGQHEFSNLAEEAAGGTSGVRGGDVAACDGQKVFGLDTGNIADMRGRTAHFKRSEDVFGQVVAQAGLEE